LSRVYVITCAFQPRLIRMRSKRMDAQRIHNVRPRAATVSERLRACLVCTNTVSIGTQWRMCGATNDTRACTLGPCSQWGDWTAWTGCSTTCGDGQQRRSRFCNTYVGCPGPQSDTRTCNVASCDLLTQWGPWGPCSRFCDTGMQSFVMYTHEHVQARKHVRARAPCTVAVQINR